MAQVTDWQCVIHVKTREAGLFCEPCATVTPHEFTRPDPQYDASGQVWYWKVMFGCKRCNAERQFGSVASERKRVTAIDPEP